MTEYGQLLGSQDPFSSNLVRFKNMDNVLYDFMIEKDEPRREIIEKGEEIHSMFPELAKDIYMSLYKQDLEIKSPDEVESSTKTNRQLLETLTDQDDFQQLRDKSRLNWMNSLVLSTQLEQRVMNILERAKQRKENAPDPGSADGDIPSFPGLPGDADSAGDQPEISDEDLSQQLQDDEQEVTDVLQCAIEDALDSSNQLSTWQKSFGHEPGDPNLKMNYADVKKTYSKLTEYNSQHLKDIIRQLGRMRAIAGKVQKRKPPESLYGLKGVKVGSEIQDVIPSDLMTLMDPKLEDIFWQKHEEQSLLVYDRKTDDPEGEGPVVVCVDTSGSMEGEPIVWAKAVALAVLEQTHAANRDVAIILYDSCVQACEIFPKRERLNNDRLLDIATSFSAGGTSFMAPLDTAREIISNNDRFRRADILFITDGDSGVYDDWVEDYNQWRDKENVHIVSCFLGDSHSDTVNRFSDRIIKLSEKDLDKDKISGKTKDIFVDLLSS